MQILFPLRIRFAHKFGDYVPGQRDIHFEHIDLVDKFLPAMNYFSRSVTIDYSNDV